MSTLPFIEKPREIYRFCVTLVSSPITMQLRSRKKTHTQSEPESTPDKRQVTENADATKEPKKKTSIAWKILNILKYMLLLIIIPPFLNYVALLGESQKLKPEGELYDVGHGQLMYLGCRGKGTPTVILDAPTGMSSDVWSLVQSQLSKVTKVCVYDRAGIGFSHRPHNGSQNSQAENQNTEVPKATNDRWKWEMYTVERMVDDLHRLISFSSQQPRPLILVGAELGSLVARFYAHMYEGEVSHLVLVDPLVEEIFTYDEGIWSQFWFQHLIPSFQSLQLSAATGVTRLALLAGMMNQPITGQNIPEEVKIRQKHLLCHPKHMSSVVDEYFFINESFSQIRILHKVKPFPKNISVTVITGNYYDDQLPSSLNKAWAKSQEHLVSKTYPRSKHIVVNGADHTKMFTAPDDIVQPLRRLVKQWRSSQKAPSM